MNEAHGAGLAKALELAGEGVLEVDGQGVVRAINRAAERLLGLQSREALGRPHEEVLSFVDEEGHPAEGLLTGVMARPEDGVARGETLFQDSRGERICLGGWAAPLVGTDGRLHAAIQVFARADGRARIHGLLHEVNNALGAVRGYCEVACLKREMGEALDRRMAAAVETLRKLTPLLVEIRNLGGTRAISRNRASSHGTNARLPEDGAAFPASTEQPVLLLVEDNDEMRGATHDLLSALGYRAEVARDGASALAVWTRAQVGISLLITDLSLPDMSGEQLLDRLRLKDPSLPCLFISAQNLAPCLVDRSPSGATAFLRKPYSAAQLVRELSHLI